MEAGVESSAGPERVSRADELQAHGSYVFLSLSCSL
jgi:hypothetical protein